MRFGTSCRSEPRVPSSVEVKKRATATAVVAGIVVGVAIVAVVVLVVILIVLRPHLSLHGH
jgi:hypothetical protein